MRIETTHHIDASEPDPSGMHAYHYEYDIYRFHDAGSCLVARSYVDTPQEAHFLGIEIDGQSRHLIDADLVHPLLAAAAAHLRAIGKQELYWLSGRGKVGYEPLPTQ